MQPSLLSVIFTIGLALFFAFTNGLHDSSNQVATIISSRVLSPEVAIALTTLADFSGAYFLGTSVAKTIGKGIIDPTLIKSSHLGISVLACALLGAISWNMVTWYLGLPSSSSHALIGGLIGAFVVGWGWEPIQWKNVRDIIGVMLLSPLAGFALSYLVTKITFFFGEWLTPKANTAFKGLQTLSLIGQSLAHGSNDAQKIMGVVMLELTLGNFYPLTAGPLLTPPWVIFSCASAMSLGIVFGGWKIIRTLGTGLYRVRAIHSFSSQSASGVVMLVATFFGFPISTTQVISSSILGAGTAFRPKSVRWAVAGEMLIAWLITLPASALIAAGTFELSKRIFFKR